MIKQSKIYIKLWLVLKPYKTPTVTDAYYLKLSNQIKDCLNQFDFILIQRYLDTKQINFLSCFLASWFEDVISDVGIWKAFTGMHRQYYGKILPFYDTVDYLEDEINEQDVAFLIWYFLNTMQMEKFISPYNDFILHAASAVMEILDKNYEYAPENNYLKTFYRLDENVTDYYVARNLIDTILFKTWLFYPDTLQELLENEAKIIEKLEDDPNLVSYLNENRDNVLHSAYTRIMSLKGKEWAAKIVGDSHPLNDAFFSMSERAQGNFFYKGQNNDVIFLEHISTGTKFELVKKSFDFSAELTKTDTIVFVGMVRWMEEWWFSGVYAKRNFDADLVLDEKNSLESRRLLNLFTDKSQETKDYLQLQYDTFLRYNNGPQIAFMPTSEIQGFLDRWIEYFNNSLNLTDQQNKESEERVKKDGFFHKKEEKEVEFDDDEGSGLVFFNPEAGIYVETDANSAFPLPNNPFFDENESANDVLKILISREVPAELAQYCIKHGKNKLPFFTEGNGKLYLRDMDFLLRFWKGAYYHSQPQYTPIGPVGRSVE